MNRVYLYCVFFFFVDNYDIIFMKFYEIEILVMVIDDESGVDCFKIVFVVIGVELYRGMEIFDIILRYLFVIYIYKIIFILN